MIIQNINSRAIFRIFICLAVMLITTGSKSFGQFSEKTVLMLNSPTRYEREQAVIILRQADSSAVLEQFKREFQSLYHESRIAFTEKVLPNMSGEDVDVFFLEELRSGLKNHLERLEFVKRFEKDEQGYKYEARARELYERDQWWMWVVRSRSDLSYVSSYDEIYEMFRKLNKRGFPLFYFAQALHKRDSSRAEADFEKLLFDPDKQMKLRGIWALEAIKYVPSFEITRKYFDSTDIKLLDQSVQYFHIIGRNDLELLLFLVTSPSRRVRNMAEYQLGRMAYLTPDEIQSLMEGLTNPQQRAETWRTWWEKHKDDTEQILRSRAASILVKQAKQHVGKELLSKLAVYHEQEKIYPIFSKALLSTDRELQKAALSQLSHIAAWKNNPIAVDKVISFCRELSAEEYGEYAGFLVRINDKRATSLLLEMLETQHGEDTKWRNTIASSMGKAGQTWAVEPLVRMVIEDGSSSAASALTHVEGAERAIPQLLDALIKEKNHIKRYALVEAIKVTGAEDLDEKLTNLLYKIPADDSMFQEGIRYDVLKLMEFFPDPNAKPLLLELLKSKNPWDKLGAARVLGKLGDDSGIHTLIRNIKPTVRISASYYNNRIGDALRMIGSVKTQKLLEKLYKDADFEVKKLILHIMAQQLDPAYLSFLGKQLKSSNNEIADAAQFEIGYLVFAYNEEKKSRQWGKLDILEKDDLKPIRKMLLWAFFNKKMGRDNKPFPDGGSLAKLKGAVIRVSRYQQIEFNKAEKSLKLTTLVSRSDLIASDGTKAGKHQPYAGGEIKRSILGDYMTIFLHLNYGGASCQFKRGWFGWKFIGYGGGVIE